MEKKYGYNSLVVVPSSKKVLNSLMVYFDSTNEDDCLLEINNLLSRIFGGLKDECIISTKEDSGEKGVFEYDCHIKIIDKHIDLSLSYLYGKRNVTIDFGDKVQTFIYDKYSKSRDLVLLNEEKKNVFNGNVYKRIYSDYGARFILTNGDYALTLDTSIHTDKNREELIINKHEEELENYLLNLDLPVNIYIVHVNICKILDIDLKELPNYTLKFIDKKKVGKYNEDTISFGYGTKNIISRNDNGKTLIITEDGFKHIDRDNKNEIIKDKDGIIITNYYVSQEEMNSNEHFMYNNLNRSVQSLIERLDNPAIKERRKKDKPIIKKITPYKFD